MCLYYLKQKLELALALYETKDGKTYASLQCLKNGILLFFFILPGAKANGWDSGSSVQFLNSRGHLSSCIMLDTYVDEIE
jgi:hypothetical protein